MENKLSPNVQLTTHSATYGSEPVAGYLNSHSQLAAICSKLATNVTSNATLEPKNVNNYAQSTKKNETQNKCDNKVNNFKINCVGKGIKNFKISERELVNLHDDNVKECDSKLSKPTCIIGWKWLLKIFVCLVFFSFSIWTIFIVPCFHSFNDFYLPGCNTNNISNCNIDDFLNNFEC